MEWKNENTKVIIYLEGSHIFLIKTHLFDQITFFMQQFQAGTSLALFVV